MGKLTMRRLKQGFFCVLLGLGFAGLGYGQGLGGLVGTVTDSTGAVIPSATIKVTQVGTGLERSVRTNEQGYFVVPSLQPSQYRLEVIAPGFGNFTQENITLQADQVLTVNAVLQVGAAQQSVTVSSIPPQVDTTTPTLSQVVNEQSMIDMPLNGRNAATLTMLTAGTVATPAQAVDQGATKTFPGGVTISTNGARQSQISWNLDGGDNQDILTNINQPFPFPDALQEFSVQTSNYSARYGGNAGGVVNVITKSGANQFHGDAFEFIRNAVFDARNYFASRVDQLKRNQFGGIIGGPVKKDRTFFFGGYQGTINHNTSTNAATVPTMANEGLGTAYPGAGDFSALLDASSPNNPNPGKVTKIINPTTGQQFSYNGAPNVIPPGYLDPAALKVASMLPQTTGNGAIQYVMPLQQTFNEFLTRIDHSLSGSGSGNDLFTARYYYDRFVNAAQFSPTNLLAYADSATILSQNALLSEQHTFGHGLLNEVHLSYSRIKAPRLPPSGAPSMNSLGVNIYDGGLNAIQSIQATNLFSFGDNPPAVSTRNNYRLNEDVSWIHGRHSLYFGGSAELDYYDFRNPANVPGIFSFNADLTNWGLAAFMTGQINQLTQGMGQYAVIRGKYFGFYAQDDFHANPRLTLNFGLRYDPFYPVQNQTAVMVFSQAAYQAGTTSTVYTNAPKGLLFPGDPGVPRWGFNGQFSNVSPRFGFAYDVFGNGKTSVRGGLGMFYDTHYAAINSQNTNSITPFSPAVVLTKPKGPFSNPYLGITNPFPAPIPAPKDYIFPTPVEALTYDPTRSYTVPVNYNWNLTIEHQLTAHWLLRAAYVASHGSHQQEYIELNPAIYSPGSGLTEQQTRPFQPYSLIGQMEQDVNSSYNSLQLALQKRMSHGFTILANYTYSKLVDDKPYNQQVVAMNVTVPNVSPIPWYMSNRHSMDYGPADWDRAQNFVASYVWTLPALAGMNPITRNIAGGWAFTGIANAYTGDPLTILAGKDQSLTALNTDMANPVPGVDPYGGNACGSTAGCVNYLNPSAFAMPAIGTFGTARKGSLRGPGYFDWDMGFFKIFPLPVEHMQLQFRAEFFNVFNRANFLDPTTSVASSFGQIRSAHDPRIGQLALKLSF